MKFLLLLIFLLISPLISMAPADNSVVGSEPQTIVIIFDKTYENQSDDIISRELNTYLNNSNYKIFRIYMNCCPYCPENKMTQRFNKALRRAADKEPDFLIIGSPSLWTQFHEKIEIFKNSYDVKVGLFDNFESKPEFKMDFNDKYLGYFVDYSSFDLNTFMFYTKRNGIKFNHFYILRDDSPNSLMICNHIRRELKKQGILNVDIRTISSLLSLKKAVVSIQTEPAGILIPIISQLFDSDSEKEILTTLTSHNRRHIELSLLEDETKYISFSLSHIIRTEFSSFKKYLDIEKEICDLNLTIFLTEFDGKHNMFAHREVYFIMNEKRVKKIFNGYKLLRFKNNFVDFLR